MNDNEDRRAENSLSVTGLIGLIIIIAIGIWGYNNFFKPDRWSLLYENDLGVVVLAGNYKSREECSSKLSLAHRNPAMLRPECGSNCEPPSTFKGPYICDDTFEL